MTKKAKAEEHELRTLEDEFHSLLISCVQECAAGRWGLFGQNDADEYLRWPEAARLRALAGKIIQIRSGFGIPNKACERYVELCSVKKSNTPGEPKLAEYFLAELQNGSLSV